MSTALFHNFTSKPFTGYWNGKAKTFKPGAKQFMPLYLAQHYAKHLANAVLMEKGGVYETYTSPKKPQDVPAFLELFQKACIPQEETDDQDETETAVDLANRPSSNITIKKPERITGPGEQAQVVVPPAGDEDDEESTFEGNQA